MLKGGQRFGAGRPAAADSRRHLIQFRVTENELRDVKETASHLGLTVTDLVRKALGLAVLVLLALACKAAPAPDVYSVDWIFAPEKVAACDELAVGEDWIAWCDGPAIEMSLRDGDCLWTGDAGWWVCSDSDEPDAIVGELFLGDGGPPAAAFTARIQVRAALRGEEG